MKLKIMTMNLRYPCDRDGINYWEHRKPNVLRVIDDECPDLIGFQEATDEMRSFLREKLFPRYGILGCGRNADYRGEGVCIAYRYDCFELVGFDTFWLSDTPEIPGSRYEGVGQSACPRMTVCARFSPVENKKDTFCFFNTHLDYATGEARTAGMRQIVAEIGKWGGPFLLAGDMNADPDSECIAFARSVTGVVDATAHIKTTFHEFGKRTTDCKIDYIFTNGRPLGAYAVPDEHRDGIYISDHYPVCVTIEF